MDILAYLPAVLLALAVGAGGVGALWWADRSRRHRTPETEAGVLDRNGIEVLGVLASTVILLDTDDDVVRATSEAYSYGLVRNDSLVHDELKSMVRKVREDGRTRERQFIVSRSALEGSGRLRLDVRAALLTGGVLLLLVDDTTAQLRLEETRRDFVANVSHELKTPVGAIGLLAETVEDCADEPDTVRHFAGRMQIESRRLSTLVQEIIDLSRLQEPDALRNPEVLDVDTVVQEAVDAVRVAAGARRITLVAGGVPDLGVYGDRYLLVTALRNLLDNAVRHSHDGGRVSVGISHSDQQVRIAVVDQGDGIEPEYQGRVFERFFRVDPARSRETGGTGLGLSIVKHVVADHGGRVDLWSEPGKGSTFTVVLPEASASAEDGQDTTEEDS